ncbi:MAG: hypothetical protein WD115_05540 [Balneolaceae bacterium]
MALKIEKIETDAQVERFHALPHRLHDSSSPWIPPFRFEIERIFTPGKNPWYEQGDCERFLVSNGSEDLARFAVMTHQRKDYLYEPVMGGMGFIEMVNDGEVAGTLIDAVKAWHLKRGRGAFRGPVNAGENDHWWGLLVQNYEEPPIYGMDYHPPYYRELLEATGAEKLDDHYSYKRFFSDPLPERLVKITDRIESRPGVELRPVRMDRLEEDAEAIRQIYNEAWREQDIVEREKEFTELTRESVQAMVKQLKPVMIPDSVLIAFVNGDPASFIVCVPDLNEISAKTGGTLHWWDMARFWRFGKRATRLRTLVFGTKPTYRKTGMEALTFVRGIQMTKKAAPKLEYLEGAWVSEKNWLMQRSLEALGCHHHKTHRTYRWLL